MKHILTHALSSSVAVWLLLGSSANALELTVHEDSATRLDFTVDWSDPGDADSIYYSGGPAPGGWPPNDTFVEVEEHLPLIAVQVLSKYFSPVNYLGYLDFTSILLHCHWTYPDADREGGAPPTDPAWDRTLDSIENAPPWYQISQDRQSARFVYGLPPSLPEVGSTLSLALLSLSGIGLLRRVGA